MSTSLSRIITCIRALLPLMVAATMELTHANTFPPSEMQMDAAEEYSLQKGGQTFLVIHQGKIIRESYTNGGNADRLQLLGSGTKGFVGVIGAIAAHDGIINLDAPVSEVLTEWEGHPLKSKITYRHLLTMSSGLEELKDQSAWTDFLNAEALYPPGSTFIYGPDPNLFGLALQRKLGSEKVEDYMTRRLFQPLGLRIEWRSRFDDGNPQLSGGAFVRANEWYKFGEFVRLMLEDKWTGPSLLPKESLEQVITGSDAYPAYGFYWWLKEDVPNQVGQKVDQLNNNQFTTQIKPILEEPVIPDDFMMCRGAYGQCLYVIPSRELVVVRNAPATSRELFQDDEFLFLLLSQTTSTEDPPKTLQDQILVYPNPVDEVANIRTKHEGLLRYTIFSLLGQQLIADEIKGDMIPLQGLSAGKYLIQFTDIEGNIHAIKPIIKH